MVQPLSFRNLVTSVFFSVTKDSLNKEVGEEDVVQKNERKIWKLETLTTKGKQEKLVGQWETEGARSWSMKKNGCW